MSSTTEQVSDIELGKVSLMSKTQQNNLKIVSKDKGDYFSQVRKKNEKFFGQRSSSAQIAAEVYAKYKN